MLGALAVGLVVIASVLAAAHTGPGVGIILGATLFIPFGLAVLLAVRAVAEARSWGERALCGGLSAALMALFVLALSAASAGTGG